MKRDRRSTLHSQSRDAALSSKRGAWRGQLVRSRAGRDKGQYYLVLADSEDGFVWLADGRKRPADDLKRKNVRHLQPVRKVAADLLDKEDGRSITNEEIRAAINAVARTLDTVDPKVRRAENV